MKRSIIAGLNYVGSPYELPDCHLDAAAVAKRAKDAGFRGEINTSIFGVNDFLAQYEQIRSKAKRTDTTLLAYSGHGSQQYKSTSIEKDKSEEYLCFWNGREIELLPDDDFRRLIENIPGAVYVFLDCCFPAGMSRAEMMRDANWRAKSIPFDPSFKIYRPSQERGLIRAASAIGNKMYFMFAAQENEVSYSTGQGGLFTRNFCDNYDATAHSKRTIKRIMADTGKNCAPDQHPKYEIIGGNTLKLVF